MKNINIKKLFISCLAIIPLCSFANEIELFYEDYEIIYYTEVEMVYENRLQMNLMLKITNPEKLNRLKNSIEPIIYVNFNNHKYVAKGNFILSSSVPPECDYFFATNENGKIIFPKDEMINFIGFKNKN